MQKIRLGSVSYLNAKPLIYGLERDDGVELNLAVPSKLLEGLREGRFDVALLPVIDYQRMEGLRIVPSGGIGSDGETLTVRIFSRGPIEKIERLACDTDSHTSVALARVLLAERYGRRPELVDLGSKEAAGGFDGLLLIGDKVVCEEPEEYGEQIDLGESWKELTGLPFVFAAWMVRQGVELGDLPMKLEAAKRAGLKHVDELVRAYAVPRGWPAEVARRYLTQHLKYDIGPREIEAIALFHQLAAKHGVLAMPPRAVKMYKPGA
ncbi:MAG TPA: menaquinone biosynthesis protein [Tepidisphaeraceae bacterium]|jgi:chorismate dehydratase|nr:menaquinone biosynthesis protein [Tepidisphaeraceae bacterium]